ncbi:MAG: DNA-directed RNA polymerase subunit beta [Chloroflexi bacterium]|nr:DNA-directed RNA polymerase subunit beta [Chloroflexota bacterium]
MSSPNGHHFGTVPNHRDAVDLPELIAIQRRSFQWFVTEGLREVFAEISPIEDFTGKNFRLHFEVPEQPFEEPKHPVAECRENDRTYHAPLYVNARLENLQNGEIKENRVFMGDFPLMTDQGTFIYNGAERVVVCQLVRSPGVYFTGVRDRTSGRYLYSAKLLPNRGAWLEFDTSAKDVFSVKVDRKRKIAVTTLIKAMDKNLASDEAIRQIFEGAVPEDADHQYLEATLDDDSATSHEEAVREIYNRLRPGDTLNIADRKSVANARSLIESTFFNSRRYDLGRVGRYKLNLRLRHREPFTDTVLLQADIIEVVRELIRLNLAQNRPEDVDHLGNRRVRAVGELLINQLRTGLLRMERVVKERMSIQDASQATPNALINARPIMAAIKEFFGGSQLAQFMDQTNPLSELAHKRRLSAMGPGGLSRERAGVDVRDVHHSHYGRICPIETPEGPNVGLISSLASFAGINEYGFLQTPYEVVGRDISFEDGFELEGRILREDLIVRNRNELAGGEPLDADLLRRLRNRPYWRDIRFPVVPFATGRIRHCTADEEDGLAVAPYKTVLNERGEIDSERIDVRIGREFHSAHRNEVDLIDVSPQQIVSIPTSLIPFLEHDDANRALMGSNMQRQAVPLLRPEAPLVATGVERRAALDSGHIITYDGPREAEVINVLPDRVELQEVTTRRWHRYPLRKFGRSNQGTCINQTPAVVPGQVVQPGGLLASASSSDGEQLALGKNLLCAFMFWEGYNYEDAIIISERLVREDVYTSIHIEKFEVEARDTKLGPEEITRDIPNVSEEALRFLDDGGIVFVGAEVGQDDIIVGKITPKGETELTGEDRLLRAIFGRDAREVKDSSKHVPAGDAGTVIDVKELTRDANPDLRAGVNHAVRVRIASRRKIMVGDKMAGRHGNKGVISLILPEEDMPYLEDGTPVDIVLNPLGAASRMNVGQLLELHTGLAAERLDRQIVTPVFDGASEGQVHSLLDEAGLPTDGKVKLYDGRTGESFDKPVVVGRMYMLKLAHLVEDKIHGRSTGPYSLITQQPLGGKAQMGGQRFGEMEVWALQAYGAANILQEMLTVKSDDVLGRVKTYEAIVKGETVLEPGVPESFRVLVNELKSLGLSVDLFDEEEKPVEFSLDAMVDYVPNLGGINIEGREYKL